MANDKFDERRGSGKVWTRLNAARYLVLFGSIIFLLAMTGRGIDFSDEAFFFASIAFPERLGATIHPFGYLLALPFAWVGKSFIALRLAGILGLALCGAFLGWRLENQDRSTSQNSHGLWQVGALTALCSYGLWTLTPTYNHLIIMAVCLIFGGVLWWRTNDKSVSHALDLVATICVGLGGFFACFAKPPVAILAGAAVIVFLTSTRSRQSVARLLARLILSALIAVILSVLTLNATVGIGTFTETIQNGLTHIKFGNSPLELVGKTVADLYYSSPLLWITLTVALLFALTYDERKSPMWRKLSAALLVACSLFFVYNVLNGVRVGEAPFVFIGVATLCLGLAVLLFLFVRHTPVLARSQIIISGVLLVLPLALSFGSAISILAQTGVYVGFTLLAFVYLARSALPLRSGQIVEAGAFAFVPLLLLWSASAPFGLPSSIFAQNTAMEFPFSRDRFWVDISTAQYANDLRTIARDNAVDKTTPMIDFTGTGAGTVLLMGGRAPYYPWLISAIGDPLPVADAQWASLSESERRRAWMIGPVPPKLVASSSARQFAAHAQDYRRVGCLTARTRLNLPHRVELWAPRRAGDVALTIDCK